MGSEIGRRKHINAIFFSFSGAILQLHEITKIFFFLTLYEEQRTNKNLEFFCRDQKKERNEWNSAEKLYHIRFLLPLPYYHKVMEVLCSVKIFDVEFSPDLYVLRSPESKNVVFGNWSVRMYVCVCDCKVNI